MAGSIVQNLYNKQTLSPALRPGPIRVGPGLVLEEPTMGATRFDFARFTTATSLLWEDHYFATTVKLRIAK